MAEPVRAVGRVSAREAGLTPRTVGVAKAPVDLMATMPVSPSPRDTSPVGRRRAAAPPRRGPDRARTAARGLGQFLITVGLIVLLFATYEVYGKAWQVGADQNQLNQDLAQQWQQPSAGGIAQNRDQTPLPGAALARLYVPKLDKQWVVVEGVDLNDIELGPGHYPQTALPGEPGNFSIAGHRMPAVFWDLDKIVENDVIGVETRNSWFVYRVSDTAVVAPDAVDVVAPVPGKPGATPKNSYLTLTTCNPKWDNYQRLVVHAQLVDERSKPAAKPAELGG